MHNWEAIHHVMLMEAIWLCLFSYPESPMRNSLSIDYYKTKICINYKDALHPTISNTQSRFNLLDNKQQTYLNLQFACFYLKEVLKMHSPLT